MVELKTQHLQARACAGWQICVPNLPSSNPSRSGGNQVCKDKLSTTGTLAARGAQASPAGVESHKLASVGAQR